MKEESGFRTTYDPIKLESRYIHNDFEGHQGFDLSENKFDRQNLDLYKRDDIISQIHNQDRE